MEICQALADVLQTEFNYNKSGYVLLRFQTSIAKLGT